MKLADTKLLKINFIGCGRLGKTLARLLKNVASIKGIVNPTLESTQNAIQFIGEGVPCQSIAELPAADIFFITTPDSIIKETCEQLVNQHPLTKNSLVVHCSGPLSSDLLSSANCRIASIHPVKSFAEPEMAFSTFVGTLCALESPQPAAILLLKNLFEQIGAVIFAINREQKALYHAACVMASNYLTALHAQASQLYEISGLSAEIAKKITSLLMGDTLQNLQVLDHRRALTGPLQRGDIETVQNHLNALTIDPLSLQVYTSLSLAALPLTTHSETILNEFRKILQVKPQ